MKRFGPYFVAFCLVLLSIAAKADTTNPVSGSGGGFSGSGTLYATDNGDGSYAITGITGPGVTGLITAGQFNSNDNLLFPVAASALDASGFAFTDTQGDTNFQVDMFSNGTGYDAYILDSDGVQMTIPVTFALISTQIASPMFAAALMTPQSTTAFDFSYSVSRSVPSATPEPSSLALMGTGFLGLASLLRRRKRC